MPAGPDACSGRQFLHLVLQDCDGVPGVAQALSTRPQHRPYRTTS